MNLTDISLVDALRSAPWAQSLTAEQMARVEAEVIERFVPAGDYACRKGESVDYWIGLVDGLSVQIDAAIAQLQVRREELRSPGNPAERLAERIGRTLPLVYGGGPLGEVAAWRWKGQFNENPKVPSWSNRIPELTHNELAGWAQHGDVTRQVFTLLFLRHDFEHPNVSRRFDFVATACDEVVADIHTVQAQGDGPLAQLMDLVMQGDFVTLHLAVQSGVDPGPIAVLDDLKNWLRA